jgi:hypothetical protein
MNEEQEKVIAVPQASWRKRVVALALLAASAALLYWVWTQL